MCPVKNKLSENVNIQVGQSNIDYGDQKKKGGGGVGGVVMATKNGIHVENVEIADVINMKIATRGRSEWRNKKLTT